MGRLRWMTAGESHGRLLAAVIEGLPAGLKIDPSIIDAELGRRQRGYGRGRRSRAIENDRAMFVAGVRNGETMGSPVLIEIENLDHQAWSSIMAPFPTGAPSDARTLTRPRPGHADLAGGLKYGRSDLRDALERASARGTAARVAAGSVARALLSEIGVEVMGFVTRIGGAAWAPPEAPDWKALAEAARASDVGCPDADASAKMRLEIDRARDDGDTVGGTFTVVAIGVPTGLGSYSDWDRKLDGRLAQAIMSIPAVKAVEIGLGVECARRRGSEVHDPIAFNPDERMNGSGGYVRPTNRAGGLEGGITNGAALVVHGSMKPISTLAQPLASVDTQTKEPTLAAYERSDVCAVPACCAIAEAAVALVLADAAMESYGGDTMTDLCANHRRVVERFAAT